MVCINDLKLLQYMLSVEPKTVQGRALVVKNDAGPSPFSHSLDLDSFRTLQSIEMSLAFQSLGSTAIKNKVSNVE